MILVLGCGIMNAINHFVSKNKNGFLFRFDPRNNYSVVIINGAMPKMVCENGRTNKGRPLYMVERNFKKFCEKWVNEQNFE